MVEILGIFKSMGTRASEAVAYIDATSSFGTKMRIEKGGKRKWATVSSADTVFR
ncbi:hypothetical protein E2C01_048124 [Portunus trituberculatus]|uniref:Uncharacterized protein n=1 Tax=Portunus trituberculatus TaxID=210409 RepID=A0A5B7G9Q6_PORTR|nr:hypothetical protein [Portunus trituberculatus]